MASPVPSAAAIATARTRVMSMIRTERLPHAADAGLVVTGMMLSAGARVAGAADRHDPVQVVVLRTRQKVSRAKENSGTKATAPLPVSPGHCRAAEQLGTDGMSTMAALCIEISRGRGHSTRQSFFMRCSPVPRRSSGSTSGTAVTLPRGLGRPRSPPLRRRDLGRAVGRAACRSTGGTSRPG